MIVLTGTAGAVLYAILGLVGGSFATAASYRLPRGLPIAIDRSRCATCGHALGGADLVPVLSWVVTRGRCRHCGAAVSARYPLIELAAAGLFVLAWWRGSDPFAAALLALTMLGLLIIVVADLEERIIPDKVQIAMIPLALLWRWHMSGDWLDGAAGAIGGGLLAYAVRAGFTAIKGTSGLGLGDIKFIALAGLYIGFTGLPPFLILSGVGGIAFGSAWRLLGRGAAFPFGPALCAALAAALFLPEWFQYPYHWGL